jgi:hypothetical protein
MTQGIPPGFVFPLLIILPLVIFWVWMFRDMMNNDDLPSLREMIMGNRDISGLPVSDPKSEWALAFIFLNVFGAVIYYAVVYRSKR